MSDQTALTVPQEQSLVIPENPHVMALAESMGWTPEHLCDRIVAVLPSPLEQGFYLQIAEGKPIAPTKFRNILREFTGGQELKESDMISREIGTNLVANKFKEVSDLISEVLELFGDIVEAGQEIKLSGHTAAKLVLAYGKNASSVLNDIVANVDEIRERLRMDGELDQVVINKAIRIAVKSVSGEANINRPHAVDIMELFPEPEESDESDDSVDGDND